MIAWEPTAPTQRPCPCRGYLRLPNSVGLPDSIGSEAQKWDLRRPSLRDPNHSLGLGPEPEPELKQVCSLLVVVVGSLLMMRGKGFSIKPKTELSDHDRP